MNTQTKKLADVNKSNYTPAAAEQHLVHYKAEIPRYDNKTGRKQSQPSLVKTGLKLFPSVKRELEKQGYVIEIVYHPEGKYNTPVQTALEDNRDAEIAALKAELAQKEEEMQALADKVQDAAAVPAKEEPKAAAKTAKKK